MKWFLNLSTRTKIIFSFGLMFILMTLIILTAILSIRAINESQRELVQSSFRSALNLVEIRADQNRERSQLLEMLLTTDKSKQQALSKDIKERSAETDQKLKELMELKKGDQKLLSKIQEINSIREEYRKTREEEISLILKGKIEEARQLGVGVQEERYNRIRSITFELGAIENEHAQQKIVQSEQKSRSSSLIFLTFGISAFLFGIWMTATLTRVIATPLKEIAQIAERVAAGDMDVIIPAVNREDEVGILSQTFRRMVDNISVMAGMTKQIAAGDLSVRVTPQSEKDVMGNALSSMVDGLQDITRGMVNGINLLASAAGEIMSTVSEFASSSSETASAINETNATVQEVRQTTDLTSLKAKHVYETAQKSVNVAKAGMKSVDEAIGGMQGIHERMGFIAERIVNLSEQSQAIGDIIATVNDLAEQSNLLAVNAAIEAAKAGEQGRGFAVVAQEVKNLATQSKQATAQVRGILGVIQKATTAAVLATEQGSKAVEAGMKQSSEAGEAIRLLSASIEESSNSTLQIVTSTQEQAIGMDQIATAIQSINQASNQNVEGSRQIETATRNIYDLNQKLQQLVSRYKVT